MKKRNLFLSLICSIILTVALATFTIISVVSPKKDTNTTPPAGNVSDNNQNVSDGTQNPTDKPVVEQPNLNEGRDGSAEKPYYIYDAESFIEYVGSYGYVEIVPVKVPVMQDAVDEDGNVILDDAGNPVQEPKLDDEGNVVTEDKKDEEGNVIYTDSCYFELSNDIDFAGVEYTTLFNQDKPFNGHIDGKGYALKNVSINVTKDNLASFVYKNTNNKDRYDANIALFGRVESAEIVGLKLDNISVVVADDVYSYVAEGGFFKDFEQNAMNDIKVSTLAAVAKNSKLSVEVVGEIKAAAYTLVVSDEPQSNSAVGGVVGLAIGSEIADTKANVKFTASNNGLEECYFVGGIAGQAYYTKVSKSEVTFEVSTTYTNPINIGGAFGYMVDVELTDTNVNLNVKENVARGTFKNFSKYGYDHATSSWVAGIATIAKAADGEIVKVENVNVVSNVELDAVYAGAVLEVSESSVAGNVTFKNVNTNSNVDVLEAFGFARYMGVATVEYDAEDFETDENNNAYNIKLTGKVILANTIDKDGTAVSIFENGFILARKGANLKVVVSEDILYRLTAMEKRIAENEIAGFVVC